jgi:parallel beta helix pectate lyase-like protein/pectate lyase-like protein
MSGDKSNLLSRREMAQAAMIGGASLFLGSAAFGASGAPAGSEMLDVRKLGAAGDGKADDTLALQRAFDSAVASGGGVFVPPGVYRTRELHVRPGIAVVGVPAWNYSGPGGSVLRLADADSTCLLNMTDARGSTLDGLSLDGGGLGAGIHGIFVNRDRYAEHEDGFRIERCQVNKFSGDGAHLSCAWCFSVRHCMLAFNKGDGLSLRGWDGYIVDNWFSGNERAGFAARHENASVTFTANRVEWNGEENMLVTGGDGYQITGNFFDRAGTCGLALRKGKSPCTQFTVTGNYFKRSGKLAHADSYESSQVYMDSCQGVTCTGNCIWSGRDDGDAGRFTPSFGIVYKGLRNCVIRDNVLHDGALKRLIVDLGGQQDGVIVGDNPGQLFTAG